MEKRTLIALALSFLVLGFYPVVLQKFYPEYYKKSAQSDSRVKTEAAKPAAEGLAVIATNSSLGNGHAANGNGKANGNGGSTSAISLNLGATKVSFQTQADAPSCAECGSIMVRNGSCYKCLNCGSTSGCS